MDGTRTNCRIPFGCNNIFLNVVMFAITRAPSLPYSMQRPSVCSCACDLMEQNRNRYVARATNCLIQQLFLSRSSPIVTSLILTTIVVPKERELST